MIQNEQVDVVVVGSGPAGMSTVLHLLHNHPDWANRILVLDKAVHPRDKLCGGGITHLGQNALIRLGLELAPRTFDLREARLRYENLTYSFYGNPVFRIVRRAEFDHWLVKRAEEHGVTVRQGEAVTSVAMRDDYVNVVTEKSTVRAKVLVAADGSKSFVRRALKWPGESRVARLLEILTPEDEKTQPEFRDAAAVFDFTPTAFGLQGYYWDFPSYIGGRPFMNRGVFDGRARPDKPKANLKQVLSDALEERGLQLEDHQLKGHPIRWWDRDAQFSMPRVLLAGDAAGADVLMGEGISFALGYGKVAADAIGDAFQRQDFGFSSYRELLLANPLFKHLDLRTRLAHYAYRGISPPIARIGWRIMPWILRFTRWRDPDFVPTEHSKVVVRGRANAIAKR